MSVGPLQYGYGHLPFAVPYMDNKARDTATKSDNQHSHYR